MILHRCLHNLQWMAAHGISALSNVGSGCMMAVQSTVGSSSSAAGFSERRSRRKNNSKEMWSFTSNGNIKATFGNCHHYLKLSDEDKPEFYVFERILLNGDVARGQCHTRGVLATLTPRPPSYAPSSALQVRNLHTFFVCFVFLNCYNYYFVAVLS